jgi:hypothetical protein
MNNPEIKAIVVAIHRTRINEANQKDNTKKSMCNTDLFEQNRGDPNAHEG